MHSFVDITKIWLIAVRAYSLPVSIMSWLVPFIFACFKNGDIKYGILSLIGIITLHMATNLFDDAIDYTREKQKIDKGLKKDFNFQKGKCSCIFEGKLTLQQYYIVSFILFLIAAIIALYFIFLYGTNLLYIIIPTGILCALYPLLGCLGLGEIVVATIFSPLLYLGVFYSMTGFFSLEILIISISTGFLSVAVLHNHMLLDFKYDESNRKITLCRLCRTEKNAFILLVVIISLAYINIITFVFLKLLSPYFLITLFSLPTAITLYKVMKTHIENPSNIVKPNIFMGNTKEIKNVPIEQRNFLIKFLIVRNLLSIFTLLICIAVVLSKIL
ncbi:TPA: prenyltransferase [Candidatus Avigastranaerophilus faecigallinarum]|nr:prenyltransferase [Candidatus Avigastranaerophilus faecigallinarum]